jgi:hypothetical protein
MLHQKEGTGRMSTRKIFQDDGGKSLNPRVRP